MNLIFWAFIGIYFAFVFWGMFENKAKSKPVIIRTKTVVEPENTPHKRSFWSRFRRSDKEDLQAVRKYRESLGDKVRVFYYVLKYSMKKDGYYALVGAYLVQPDNYYGFGMLDKFTVPVSKVESEIFKRVREIEKYKEKEVIISKLI